MKIDQRVVQRFDELIGIGERLPKATQWSKAAAGVGSVVSSTVDVSASMQWATNSLSLLGRVFGKDSDYYSRFGKVFDQIDNPQHCKQGLAVLKAAKDDYEHGYLFETRVLIEAEVFDDFLEQAEHLLASRYYVPAAVVVGCVLEDAVRKLCLRKGITLPANPKMDAMNAELAKAGVYDKLVQKSITALADLRNKAAHGEWDKFGERDVDLMIQQVRHLMVTQFS